MNGLDLCVFRADMRDLKNEEILRELSLSLGVFLEDRRELYLSVCVSCEDMMLRDLKEMRF